MNKVFSLKQVLVAMVVGISTQACTSKSQIDGTDDASVWPVAKSPVVVSDSKNQQVNQLLAKMTVEEKVGQILQAEIQAITPEQAKEYNIGSILNGGGSTPNRKEKAQPQDWLAAADAYYAASTDTSDGGVGIPIIWGTDAVHGHNNLTGATIFPHNIGLGATRNPELIEKIGQITAAEVRASGIEWVFSPTVAVARNDRWGRTYESYSEDPQLVADYAFAMVEGLQGKANTDEFLSSSRVLATAKHFLADGGTEEGDDQGNAVMSEAELVKVHAPGYYTSIEAGVQSIMASFSSWNSEKMHGNEYLLNQVLKQKMGFNGLVVGDWNGHGQVPGCTNDSCPQSINAGVDLVMVPYDWKNMYYNTLEQVRSGEISTQRLDQAVKAILIVKAHLGLLDTVKPSERAKAINVTPGSAEHRAIARQSVRESLVLLKNNNQALPLSPKQSFVIAGPAADDIGFQSGGWSVSWQGLTGANDKFPGATSIYQGLAKQIKAAGGKATLSQDGSYTSKPDVAIVVFGEPPYAEGQGDINTLEFEAGEKQSLALLNKFKQQGIKTIAVFISGRPMWVNPELNAADAFVAAWLPGSEGEGIADVILADKQGKTQYDFSGKLSFSWPATPLQDELNLADADYQPLFPFGFGLTYKDANNLAELPEDVEGVDDGTASQIDVYVGRPLQPWHVFINQNNYKQILSGAFAELPNGEVQVTTIDKDIQEDALLWKWQGKPSSILIEGGKPLDLTDYAAGGILSFDIKVDEIPQGKVELVLNCGNNCRRTLDLTSHLRTLVVHGWMNVSVKLSCFAKPEELAAVNIPFSIEANGQGQLSFANIQILQAGNANLSCN
ncbi:glycoside hydrolase family 3 protein [Catenovulum agarivorans]|uniref:glycoside hydrolase family 3 protein n=1 Tax=Catenovulum agarivorans TaxID=1172192 RepID=UPI0002EC5C80|nr:glycoside hydrolase family 3 N-terminal domain-containing protein [Catenovulum agarivorans]